MKMSIFILFYFLSPTFYHVNRCVSSSKPAQILTHTAATLFFLCLSLESLHYLGIWYLPSSQIKNVEKSLLHTIAVGLGGPQINFPQEDKVEVH
jgi:hypothetical protein